MVAVSDSKWNLVREELIGMAEIISMSKLRNGA
jgi:hypothetical protein